MACCSGAGLCMVPGYQQEASLTCGLHGVCQKRRSKHHDVRLSMPMSACTVHAVPPWVQAGVCLTLLNR